MADILNNSLDFTIDQMMMECKSIIASNEPEAQKLLGKTLMYLAALSAASKRIKKVGPKGTVSHENTTPSTSTGDNSTQNGGDSPRGTLVKARP